MYRRVVPSAKRTVTCVPETAVTIALRGAAGAGFAAVFQEIVTLALG